jgi:hypothetical protein
MRRKLGFRIAKYSIRGLFFTGYFTIKMLSRFIKFLNRVKTEAVSNMGNCPSCYSLDLTYEEPVNIGSTSVLFKFKCNRCGKEGKEIYGLKYIKSILERSKDADSRDENGDSENDMGRDLNIGGANIINRDFAG